jgi:glutathione S-transferase
MRLYLIHGCPYAHRASIALQEKKVGFEPVFFETGKRPPELVAVGSYAKSPTLLDRELGVWDSLIVLEYIEDRYSEPRLLPSEATHRAQARMLVQAIVKELAAKLGAIEHEVIVKPPDERDTNKVASARQGFLDALGPWEDRLAGQTFVMGEGLTIVDIVLYTLFPAMKRHAAVDIPPERKHLRAWHDRMTARPSTKQLEPR